MDSCLGLRELPRAGRSLDHDCRRHTSCEGDGRRYYESEPHDHGQRWSDSPRDLRRPDRRACDRGLWVELQPVKWNESYATGVSGTTISGWLSNVPQGGTQAVMWTGANSTMVSLDPQGFQGSYAYAVSGGTVGGTFTQNDGPHSLHACV